MGEKKKKAGMIRLFQVTFKDTYAMKHTDFN